MPEPPNEQTRFVSTDADPAEGVGGAAAREDDWTPPTDDDPIFDEISEAVRVFGEKYPHEEHLWPEIWHQAERGTSECLQNEIGRVAVRALKDIVINGETTVDSLAPLLWYALHPRSLHSDYGVGFIRFLSVKYHDARLLGLWRLRHSKAQERRLGLASLSGPAWFLRPVLFRCLEDRAASVRCDAADELTRFVPDPAIARRLWRQAKREARPWARQRMRSAAMHCRFGFAIERGDDQTNMSPHYDLEQFQRGSPRFSYVLLERVREVGLRTAVEEKLHFFSLPELAEREHSPSFCGLARRMNHELMDAIDDRDALKPDLERWMAEHQACPRLAKSDWSRLIGPHRPYLDKHIVDYSIFAYHRWCDEQDKKRAARSK